MTPNSQDSCRFKHPHLGCFAKELNGRFGLHLQLILVDRVLQDWMLLLLLCMYIIPFFKKEAERSIP
jgi:hypothetical protein